MVLVVRYAGQSCVKGHHDQGELQEGPEQTSTSPSEAGLKVQHQIQHGVHGEGGVAREEGLPGFLDFAVIASAFVVLNVALGAVDEAEVRVADAQEMRTQTSYGDFGNVCEGLADGTAKEEATYLLIEGCHIGIPNCGPGLLLQVIDPVEFPCDDREDGDDDPHGAEHSIIYCLTSFQGILDAVIIAVEPSVVRLDGAGLNDQEGQASQKEAKEVEADEQRPLAAALPRVVVERRAAAVLALRDDRLVVLVVLHGAGCGAILPPREDAPQQRTHTQTRGSLPGRGCSGEWRVGPGLGRAEGGESAAPLPASNADGGVFCSPRVPLLSSSLNPKSFESPRGREPNPEQKVVQSCAARGALGWRVPGRASERMGSAGARPPSSAAGDLMNGSCAGPGHSAAPAQLQLFLLLLLPPPRLLL